MTKGQSFLTPPSRFCAWASLQALPPESCLEALTLFEQALPNLWLMFLDT